MEGEDVFIGAGPVAGRQTEPFFSMPGHVEASFFTFLAFINLH
jgi:hypothetical protein